MQLQASSLTAHIKVDCELFCFASHEYVIPKGFTGFFQVIPKLFEDLVVKRRSRGPVKYKENSMKRLLKREAQLVLQIFLK